LKYLKRCTVQFKTAALNIYWSYVPNIFGNLSRPIFQSTSN
jgi:hypothetical protein